MTKLSPHSGVTMPLQPPVTVTQQLKSKGSVSPLKIFSHSFSLKYSIIGSENMNVDNFIKELIINKNGIDI